MRVAHGSENIQEKANALLDAKLMPGAIDVDRFPRHVLEDQIGLRVIQQPGIEEPRNIGMIQRTK
jgi:hypothetical protein